MTLPAFPDGMRMSSMGFFDRLGAILKSNLNDLINRAEDPEKMLDQAITDMRKQLVEAKSRVAMAIADEKRLAKDLERNETAAKNWEQKAMTFVRGDRDDLAVQALTRKKEHEVIAAQLGAQLVEQKEAVAALKEALGAINKKIDEARRQRTLLIARQKRAEAQKAVADTLASANDPKALAPMNKMNEKIDRLEAEAQARMEVAALSGASSLDPLEQEYKLLEASSGHDGNDDLAALKRKMALDAPEPPKALPEPSVPGADTPAADEPEPVPGHDTQPDLQKPSPLDASED